MENEKTQKIIITEGPSELDKLCKDIRMVFWTLVFMCVVVSVLRLGKDSTDAPGYWGARSGMSLHRDHQTGCEYLSHGDYLTPRLDQNGKQICNRVFGA